MLDHNPDLEIYTIPTYFMDCEHPAIIEKAHEVAGGIENNANKAIALFYYVRDTFHYFPYNVSFKAHKLRASYVLQREGNKTGYCTEKAILFSALCRVFKIPNRLVFCNVRNHIGTGKIEEILGTDLLVFHGYNEVFVNDKWVKCTVAFNKHLCERINVAPLEFDGVTDQIFQEYDKEGGKFMVYEHYYGVFHEMPHDYWISETKRLYPQVFTEENIERYIRDKGVKLFNMADIE